MNARAIISAGLILSWAASSTEAADPAPAVAPVPDGWTLGSDRTYIQTASGVSCSKTMGPYAFVRLDGVAPPNILGVCVYSGGAVRVGEIRVRKFIDGVGETPLAIRNDRDLMGLEPVQGLPPGAKLIAGNRMGPGPQIDGYNTSQMVTTSVRKGLLVDCVSQTKPLKDETDFGFENFISACMHDGD